jgi:Ig-like domain from next to BRCA1 gene
MLRVSISTSVSLRHRAIIIHAVRVLRHLAMAGVIAWMVSSCGSTASDTSSAASTHSAQTLVMLITQMGGPAQSVFTPSPTSRATPSITPTLTAVSESTRSVIPTVPLTTPTRHPLRATYPGATPTTDGTSLLTQTLTNRCNAAYYVGPIPPDYSEVKAGSTFVQTWVIRNAGTCTWYPSYFLFYYSGAHMLGPDIVDFPQIIPPNKTLFLFVTLVAPSNPGTYTGRWYLRDPNFNQFGIGPEYSDPLLVKITVVADTGG